MYIFLLLFPICYFITYPFSLFINFKDVMIGYFISRVVITKTLISRQVPRHLLEYVSQ